MAKSKRYIATALAIALLVGTAGVAHAATGAPSTGLVYSTSGNSGAKALTRANVRGSIAVSIGNSTGDIQSVAYYLDNPNGTGQATANSTRAPFSLTIDTGKLKTGRHALLAVAKTSAGQTVDLFARFAISADAGTSTSAPTPAKLRILLTNDDGFDAGGIVAVHKALVKAGHDVTVVAPDSNRSGSGAKSDGGKELKQESPGVYSVTGMPADAATAGLEKMKADGGLPDLVVSGTNLGQNSGSGIVESGTVGAAVTAAMRGLPVIASSTHQAGSEADCEATADYLVRVINALNKGGLKLPKGEVLNVNYPTTKASKVEFSPAMEVALSGDAMDVVTEGVPDNDRASLDQGIATVSELDADGKAGTPKSVKDLVTAVAP